jgi:hypothetical protein
MKKTLIMGALLAGAVSVYSQGQITFTDYGAANGWGIGIYGQQSLAASTVPVSWGAGNVFEEQGNPIAAQNPSGGTLNPGTSTYISGSGLQGTLYDVQILGATGSGDAVSTLAPISTAFTGFGTGASAGTFNESANVTTTIAAGAATIAIAAWANNGAAGTAGTLAQAIADGYAWGISAPGNVTLTTAPAQPNNFPGSITSFSLGVVPEPSTIALGVIGASAFLMRLRRKS